MNAPVVLMLLAWCSLMAGCAGRADSPFVTEPAPDLAVTTLQQPDIDTVGAIIQLQGTILLGCDMAYKRPLPEPVSQLVETVRERQRSRERDLRQLVRVKNAPAPTQLGPRNSRLIEELAQATPEAWAGAMVDFQHAVHTDALRLLRDAADRSQDPDVRSFAERQLPAIASIMRQCELVADKVP